jgi:hypothetical protein
VTKLNSKKKVYYEAQINDLKNESFMGRKTNSTPSFMESDGLFIPKPFDVANYLYD